jgi:uncharacterized LabA/DUF88 family protein
MDKKRIKGNMDIELAVDLMDMAKSIDHAVIFSGDGDFRRLIENVQNKGLRVSVVSTLNSKPPMIADELRRQADFFIDLSDIRGQIERQSGVSGQSENEMELIAEKINPKS